MKPLTLTALLLFAINNSLAQQNLETVTTQPATEKPAYEIEYVNWFNQLNQHLLKSKDNYQKAMGIASTLNATLNLSESTGQDISALLPPQVNVLNELIAKTDLSNETLDLLVTWCFKPQIKNMCDQQTLLDKHMQQQPENLNVYLQPIKIAIERNEANLTSQLLKLMAQSKHSHLTYYVSPEFSQVIDEYTDSNPLPDSYIQALTNKPEFMTRLKNKSPKEREKLSQIFLKSAIKMSYAMLYDLPQIQSLYQYCKSHQDFLEECATITQILINHSDTLNAKGLGYAMLMGIHEARGQNKFLEVVADKQERYRQQLQCLSKATISKSPIDDLLDPEYQSIQLKAINEHQKIFELAMYVYSKYKDSNPEQVDPKSCYQEL